jgi:hypothetical protein
MTKGHHHPDVKWVTVLGERHLSVDELGRANRRHLKGTKAYPPLFQPLGLVEWKSRLQRKLLHWH